MDEMHFLSFLTPGIHINYDTSGTYTFKINRNGNYVPYKGMLYTHPDGPELSSAHTDNIDRSKLEKFEPYLARTQQPFTNGKIRVFTAGVFGHEDLPDNVDDLVRKLITPIETEDESETDFVVAVEPEANYRRLFWHVAGQWKEIDYYSYVIPLGDVLLDMANPFASYLDEIHFHMGYATIDRAMIISFEQVDRSEIPYLDIIDGCVSSEETMKLLGLDYDSPDPDEFPDAWLFKYKTVYNTIIDVYVAGPRNITQSDAFEWISIRRLYRLIGYDALGMIGTVYGMTDEHMKEHLRCNWYW